MPELKGGIDGGGTAGHNPVLVLAMVDELDPAIRSNPSAPSQVIKDLRDQAAREFGIAARQVMWCVNYTSEDRSNPAIGKNTLEILAAVVHEASDYLERHHST